MIIEGEGTIKVMFHVSRELEAVEGCPTSGSARLTFQAEVQQHVLVHGLCFTLHLWSLQGGVDLPGAAVLRVFQFPQAAAHGLRGGDSRSLRAVGAPEEPLCLPPTDSASLVLSTFNGAASSLLRAANPPVSFPLVGINQSIKCETTTVKQFKKRKVPRRIKSWGGCLLRKCPAEGGCGSEAWRGGALSPRRETFPHSQTRVDNSASGGLFKIKRYLTSFSTSQYTYPSFNEMIQLGVFQCDYIHAYMHGYASFITALLYHIIILTALYHHHHHSYNEL